MEHACFTLMKKPCINCHPDDLTELIFTNTTDPVKFLLTIAAGGGLVSTWPASPRTLDWLPGVLQAQELCRHTPSAAPGPSPSSRPSSPASLVRPASPSGLHSPSRLSEVLSTQLFTEMNLLSVRYLGLRSQ